MDTISENSEDAQDIAAYREAKRLNEESFPIEIFDQIDSGSSPVMVFRKYRGLTQNALSKQTGISQNMISSIENGTRDGTVKVLLKIADALDVDLDMLVGI